MISDEDITRLAAVAVGLIFCFVFVLFFVARVKQYDGPDICREGTVNVSEERKLGLEQTLRRSKEEIFD